VASPAKHSASTGVLTVGLNGALLLSGLAGHAGTPVTLAMIANWTIESELCRNSRIWLICYSPGNVALQRKRSLRLACATTLRYAYEVRDQGAYFEDIPELKLPAEMIQLASHIIDKRMA
jgi:hypothetical protein